MVLLFHLFILDVTFGQRVPYPFEFGNLQEQPTIVETPTSCERFGTQVIDQTIGTNTGSITFSSSLGLTTLTGNILINGKFIINSSLNFTNATVKMGKNAEIDVVDNFAFISSSSVFYACKNMWQGIVVTNGCYVKSLQSSYSDAEKAFTIDDNVQCIFYGNVFDRNYIGIKNGDADPANPGLNLQIFWANTFSCLGTLIAPRTGQVGFAGIDLDKCATTIGSSRAINTFTKLNRGINSKSSSVNVVNCEFSDMYKIGGYGIYAEKGSLKVDGMNQSFSNCLEAGIYTLGTYLTVENCVFSGNQVYGIYSSENFLSEKIYIHDNSMLLDNEECLNGIYVERPIAAGSSTTHGRVVNNYLSIDGSSKYGQSAILEGSLGIADDNFLVENNSVYIGTTSLNSAVGIHIGNGVSKSNSIVNRNDVSYNCSKKPNGINRFGIYFDVVSGTNQKITNNIVNSNNKTGQCAIHVEDSPNMLICSNSVNNLENGLHFQGNAANSVVGENIIGKASAGFWVQNSAVNNGDIGIQTLRNNQWLPNASDYSILAAANTAKIPKNSKIFVQNTSPTVLAITRNPFVLGDWFDIKNDVVNGCSTAGNVIQDKFSSSEWDIINHVIQEEGTYTDISLWDAKYRILVKMIEDPFLRNIDNNTQDFYNQYQGAVIAKLAAIDIDMRNLAAVGSAYQNNLDVLSEQKISLYDQIAVIDNSFLTVPDNIDNTKAAQKAQLLGQIRALENSIQEVRSVLLAERNTAANDVLQHNNSINANYLNEMSRQKLNQLRLVRLSGQEWTANNFNDAYTLAISDPYTVGAAVKEARSLLPYTALQGFISPEHDDAESRSGKRQKKNINTNGIVVYPNPSIGYLDIRFPTALEGDYLVTNILGEVVDKGRISKQSKALSLELLYLQDGIYNFSIITPENESYTSRFTIAKY